MKGPQPSKRRQAGPSKRRQAEPGKSETTFASLDESLGITTLQLAFERGASFKDVALVSKSMLHLSLQTVSAITVVGAQLNALMKKSVDRYPMLRSLHVKEYNHKRGLPSKLGSMFHRLECLTISDCGGVRSLPASMEDMTRLKELNLTALGAWGEDVEKDVIWKLTSLESLSINRCCPALRGFPTGLSRLVRLKKLTTDFAVQAIPEHVQSLPAIEELSVAFCFRGQGNIAFPNTTGLPLLRRFHVLHESDFYRSHVELSPSLATWQHLQYLHLRGNTCRGELPEWLGQLPQLEDLSIDVEFLPKLPSGFGALKSLHLKVEHQAEVVSGEPLHGSDWASLTTLLISGHFLRLPAAVGQLRALRSLSLKVSSHDFSPPFELPAMGGLESLDSLEVCLGPELDRLPSSIRTIPNLKRLIFQGSMESIPLSASWHLELLDVTKCPEVAEVNTRRKNSRTQVDELRVLCSHFQEGDEWFQSLEGVRTLKVDCRETNPTWCRDTTLPGCLSRYTDLAVLDCSGATCFSSFHPSTTPFTNLTDLVVSSAWPPGCAESQAEAALSVMENVVDVPRLNNKTRSALKDKCRAAIKEAVQQQETAAQHLKSEIKFWKKTLRGLR